MNNDNFDVTSRSMERRLNIQRRNRAANPADAPQIKMTCVCGWRGVTHTGGCMNCGETRPELFHQLPADWDRP